MTKKQIKLRLRMAGFEPHYCGKTKTFYIDNCGEHYQSLLLNDIQNFGYRVIKN